MSPSDDGAWYALGVVCIMFRSDVETQEPRVDALGRTGDFDDVAESVDVRLEEAVYGGGANS